MDENQERQHQKKKIIIRIIGSILLALGVVCAIIGFVDISKSFQEERMPMIWLFFIGFPLIAIGGFMVIVSFQRSIQRYVKNESVPVFNEMGQQIAPGISSIANSVKRGVEQTVCPDCGEANEADAKFCNKCGRRLND